VQGQLQAYQHLENSAALKDMGFSWERKRQGRTDRQLFRTTPDVGLTASREDSHTYFPSPALSYQNLHLLKLV